MFNINWDKTISRCKANDLRAQCDLYNASWRYIYPAVYRIIRNREEAEDILQNSMIKGFGMLADLREAEKYPAWQKQIAVRMALNHLRKTKTNLFPVEFSDEMVKTKAENEAVLDFDPVRIKEEIENLPNGFRIIITLHLLEGIPHESIAHELGISPATSRSQYRRGLVKLKKILHNEYESQF